MKLNSVIYHTKNLAQVKEFYESNFGLRIGTYEKDGKLVPDCSDKFVNFVLDDGTLFCFEIDGDRIDGGTVVIHVPDLTELVRSLRAKGLELKGDLFQWIKVKDPDGRSLIIEQEPPSS